MRITRQVLFALITISFVVILVSGVVLWFPMLLRPLLAVPLLTWRSLHEWAALAFTVVVVVHLIVNRRRVASLFSARGRGGEPAAIPPSQKVQPVQAAAPAGPSPAEIDGERPPRFSRRHFLILGGVALAGLVAVLTLEFARPRRATPEPEQQRTDFQVLNVEKGSPTVSPADWVLEVDGLVEHPQSFDRAAWLALERTAETRDFRCVEGWGAKGLGWEGVRVSDVLRQAGPTAEGRFVTFHAYGGTYTDSLPMKDALDSDTLLADRLDGEPLPARHGGPLRLVIPSQMGYKNVKWVVRLEVTATQEDGYWERNGYPADAPV